MSKKTYETFDLYSKHKISNRDLYIQEKIADYFKHNISVLSDGIISQIPVISSKSRNNISKYYEIPADEFMKIKKNNREFKIFKREETINELRLGLIISYAETRKPIFLNYLAILIYSSLYFKYFRNGKNDAVLKYTIETQDDRTDFKKYQMSLNIVVSKKIEAIIDFIDNKHYIERDGRVSDADLIAIYQSIFTRFNNMMRTLSQKYYANMKDDNIKIMMQYSKTLDGKNVISPLNVIENVRDVANNNLRIVSFSALNMSGLNIPSAKYYKDFFTSMFNEEFNSLTDINSLIINEYLKRNPKMDIGDFKNKFVQKMSTARNIEHINDKIDSLYDKHIKDELRNKVGKQNFRKYVYKFLIANIVLATKDVMKGGR